MKKIRLVFLLFTTLLINELYAQVIPQRENPGVVNSDTKAQKYSLYDGLNLTKEQQKNLQNLNKDSKIQVKAVREDSSLTKQEQREKLIAIKNAIDEKRKTILTPEQNAKFEKNQLAYAENKGSKESAPKKVVNNTGVMDKGKDENGLSKVSPKTASKKNNGGSNYSLGFTKQQNQELKLLTDDGRRKLRDINMEKGLSKEEKMDRFRMLQAEQINKLDAILNPEEKTKWLAKQREALFLKPNRRNTIFNTYNLYTMEPYIQ